MRYGSILLIADLLVLPSQRRVVAPLKEEEFLRLFVVGGLRFVRDVLFLLLSGVFFRLSIG